MTSYRIDTGNSGTGTAGFVAYVEAENKRAALAKLRRTVDQQGYTVEDSDGVLIRAYFNAANVKMSEVEREDA